MPRSRDAAATSPRPQLDRERVRRTLTFWLRPAFVLRSLNRFQRIAGFDRAVALASSALTALIPLVIVTGAFLPDAGGKGAADRIIDRYDLTGGGAEAVRDAFSPPTGTETEISVAGVLLLVVAVLSFSRTTQRLFEQTWELKSLSVRNSVNGLVWIAGLIVYLALSGWIHGVMDETRLQIGANLVLLPVSCAFLVWSGWLLTAKRLTRRSLLPFGRRRGGPARVLRHRRGGVRAAPVRVLRDALRRDRRGVRDDLRAVLRDAGARRVRGARARGLATSSRASAPGSARPTTRSGRSGTPSSPRAARAGPSCASRSTAAAARPAP